MISSSPPPQGRTLASYRPQHDEDCSDAVCRVCGDGPRGLLHDATGALLWPDRMHPHIPIGPCTCGLSTLLAQSIQSEQTKNDDKNDHGAGLAAVGNDTGSSTTETASEIEKQARHLSSYAASINWQPGDNTREWLLGLRDLIEHVQALTEPLPGEMTSDLDLEYLEAE